MLKKLGTVGRAVYMMVTGAYRRRGMLVALVVYIMGMLVLFHMGGSLGLDHLFGIGRVRAPPGSVYKSNLVFNKFLPFFHNGSGTSYNAFMHVWDLKLDQDWKPCINKTTTHAELPKSNGFLMVEATGGLNQQRLSICDAVAVAALLNATLVIPKLRFNIFWRDSSKFGDIFDEEFFIYALRNHVNVIRELPEDVLQRFDNNISNIVILKVKALSTPTYYLQKVLPILLNMGAVNIAPFSKRLAHDVPSNIQALRCLTNFEALRFSELIRTLATQLVDRMAKNSSKSGKEYMSVHLRFEKDMVAFSCCEYDGGDEEKHEMDIARERSWRGKFSRRGRVIVPGLIRMDGKCPLTPLEVGMMLRGMGFDNNTAVYVAAGNIYKAEKYMAPFKLLFPRLETKETLASPQELAPLLGYSSRLAALDYTVCLHSEVFVTTQGGNFPHFVMGHRRYLNEGHAKTIKPDKQKLALLFDSPKIRWETFRHQLQDMLHDSNVMGTELKKPNSSVYTYPTPDCMCKS